MTIVQPYKKISFRFIFIGFVSLLVGTLAFSGIILYNQLVDLRHDIFRISEKIKTEEVANAELKNKFFTLTDPSSPEIFLQDRGLILERNPQYGIGDFALATRP